MMFAEITLSDPVTAGGGIRRRLRCRTRRGSGGTSRMGSARVRLATATTVMLAAAIMILRHR